MTMIDYKSINYTNIKAKIEALAEDKKVFEEDSNVGGFTSRQVGEIRVAETHYNNFHHVYVAGININRYLLREQAKNLYRLMGDLIDVQNRKSDLKSVLDYINN